MPHSRKHPQHPNNRGAQANQGWPNNQAQQDQRSLAERFESYKQSHQSSTNDDISFQAGVIEEMTKSS